jgi:Cu-Zn family superoxide dismutase
MRVAILHTVFLLATVSFVANACARNQTLDASKPITNSPAARQTATSSTADLADASVQLSPTKGNSVAGELRLATEGDGVRVMGTLTALAPNSKHGIHIHEHGDCSAPDASSAGSHFNPLGHPHGAPGHGAHIGDLGNVTANPAGVAYVDVWIPRATLDSGATTNVAGRAVIVHANPDDLTSQPSGNSGPRIACGVITQRRDSLD